MNEEEHNQKYRAAIEAMCTKIREAIGQPGLKRVVEYSCYKSSAIRLPIDNLDEVAFKGKIMFRDKPVEPWSEEGAEDYVSRVLTDPTWLEMAVIANEMIHTIKNFRHVFFEGFEIVGEENGVKVADFMMGS